MIKFKKYKSDFFKKEKERGEYIFLIFYNLILLYVTQEPQFLSC
jgi:hypothetical protein